MSYGQDGPEVWGLVDMMISPVSLAFLESWCRVYVQPFTPAELECGLLSLCLCSHFLSERVWEFSTESTYNKTVKNKRNNTRPQWYDHKSLSAENTSFCFLLMQLAVSGYAFEWDIMFFCPGFDRLQRHNWRPVDSSNLSGHMTWFPFVMGASLFCGSCPCVTHKEDLK